MVTKETKNRKPSFMRNIWIILGVILALIVIYWLIWLRPIYAWDQECYRQCYSPSPSPILTPSPTASASATPTPEPRPALTTPQGPFPAPAAPQCSRIEYVPTILGFQRLSDTSIKVWWSSTDPVKDYVVNFGLSQDDLGWRAVVINTHDVTLNDLPKNLPIWVGIQPTQNGCVGQMSEILDP